MMAMTGDRIRSPDRAWPWWSVPFQGEGLVLVWEHYSWKPWLQFLGSTIDVQWVIVYSTDDTRIHSSMNSQDFECVTLRKRYWHSLRVCSSHGLCRHGQPHTGLGDSTFLMWDSTFISLFNPWHGMQGFPFWTQTPEGDVPSQLPGKVGRP